MSIFISIQNLCKSFGTKPLFERLSFGIFEGERIGVIGANGSGKSTLLKILSDQESFDEGQVAKKRLLKIAYIPQHVIFPPEVTIAMVVEEAAVKAGIDRAQAAIQAGVVLGRVGFDQPDTDVHKLSGGWKKRLSIAAALVQEPDLMLLDEPTNHLDLEGLIWLQDLLKNASFAWVLVSHDRYFLEKCVTKVAELSRAYDNGIFIADGGYSQFLEKRDAYREAKAKYAEALGNKMRREDAWLARSPQARATKAKYRIDEAYRLKDEVQDLKERLRQNRTSIDFSSSGRKTKVLIRAESVAKKLGDKPIVNDFNIILSPGKVLGLLGGNGTGKTTILKLLNQELEPDSGTIFRAVDLKMVYFDQNREKIDQTKTLRRSLADNGDFVIYRDNAVHLVSWAQRFQFTHAQLDQEVATLSGGEQARVLIAKLMLQPTDLLLLDEPTNDLDIATLEVLEDSLLDFPGAVVLVTHDRYMLDRVADYFVGLDGKGGTEIYADYSQWENELRTTTSIGSKKSTKNQPRVKERQKKLSYLEQLEFDEMESTILAGEAQVEFCLKATEDPTIASDANRLHGSFAELQRAQEKVERLYARWGELEAKIK